MFNEFIMSVLPLAWAYWSYQLWGSSLGSFELAIKKTANRDLLGIIIGLSNALRQDLFRLQEKGSDIPLAAAGRLLSIVNQARNLDARNEAAGKVSEVKEIEEEVDRLYFDVLKLYATLSGST